MSMYTGPEQRATETYMVPGTAPNSHLTYVPHYEEVDYTGSKVAPEYIYDQGLYYPAANYYGYYSGLESPGEWDDRSNFSGVDGQDLRFSGLQTENAPYVYYPPSYGYTQSPYNPYNPYIPGAVIGLDVPYIGAEQYVTSHSYHTPVSSAGYIPVVQPGTDTPNSSHGHSSFGSAPTTGGRHANSSVKYTPPLASINIAAKTQRSTSGNPFPESSQTSQGRAISSEGLIVDAPFNKQSVAHATVGSATHAAQVRKFSGSVHTPHNSSQGKVSADLNPLKVGTPFNDSFTQYGAAISGWATVDKSRPRLQFNYDMNTPSGGMDVLGEQYRAPRTNRSKSHSAPTIVDGAQPTKPGSSNGQPSIVISADQYNRNDFPVSYPDAKFFVIKSYSEDDVHKSIKYKVWSSTSNGNKRLDSAYQDAQRMSVGQPRNCPIFLFFSVNASGQFCGVAEMIGSVDFHKDMDFWQQDKWTGCFPVKWHMIKDVPNTSFRHIILENNENKPVTNSRDTQEIPYLPGLNMLNIFKGTIVKTSILDDFMFYEERESIMQEEKARVFGRSYDASRFLRAVVPVNKSNVTISSPSKIDEKQSRDIVNKPSKANEELLSGTSYKLIEVKGKSHDGIVGGPPSSTKSPNVAVDCSAAAGRQPSVVIRSPPKGDGRSEGSTPNHVVDHAAKADGKSSPHASVNRSLDKPNDSLNSDRLLAKADTNLTQPMSLKTNAVQPPVLQHNDTKSTDDHRPSKPKNNSTTNGQVYKADRNSSKLKDLKITSDEPQKSEQTNTKNTNQRPNKPKDSTSLDVQHPKADKNLSIADEPPKSGHKDSNSTSNQRPKASIKGSATTADQPRKVHGKEPKSSSIQHSKEDRNTSKPKEQVTRKLDSIISTNDKEDSKQKPAIHAGGKNYTTKAGPDAMGSKEGESSRSGEAIGSSTNDVVTIGSVPIRVKGLVESSSSFITVGTISIEPKSLKHKQGCTSQQ